MRKGKSGRMHVVRVVNRQRDREYVSWLLRNSYREDGKVKKQTLANLSHLPEPVIELVRRALVAAMVVTRITAPGSKLATTRRWTQSTLADPLGVADADEDELYAALDWLLGRQGRIEAGLARRHLAAGSVVLYDVTSSYVTGRHCELAAHGHSRDHRPDRPQVVYGLLLDAEGRPLAIEAYPGNTADPATVEDH